LIPGLIHDYGYRHDQLLQRDTNGQLIPYGEGKGRKFWDKLFLEVGNEVNGIPLLNWVAWLAVALLGYLAWRSNRKRNSSPNKLQL